MSDQEALDVSLVVLLASDVSKQVYSVESRCHHAYCHFVELERQDRDHAKHHPANGRSVARKPEHICIDGVVLPLLAQTFKDPLLSSVLFYLAPPSQPNQDPTTCVSRIANYLPASQVLDHPEIYGT